MTVLANLLALLSLEDDAYLEGLNSAQKHTNTFTQNLSNVGGAIVVGALTAAGAAVAAVGAAAWEAGNTMDEAMDKIAVATGATGPELVGLREDFEAVFSSVPADAGAAADAISVLNARLDISGPALQDLAAPLLEVSRILGGDVAANAEDFTRVMGDWNLPVEDASTSLDALFVAAQQTGAPLDKLMQNVVQYGAPMRNFGFSFDEAAGILASFEAQGVNTEIVMSGLRIAQGKFIKQGVDMNTGLWDTVEAIQNATSETDALAIATEVFGAKAAGDMFDTIRSGKFDVEALVESMMNADGAIMEAADATADWGEKWQTFKNKITVALAPVGETMMAALGAAMDNVAAIFERPDVQAGISNFVTMIGNFISQAVTYIPVLIDGFFQFISFLSNNQEVVIGILAALGVAALAWGITTAIAAWTALAPLLPVIAVLLLIGAAVYLLYQAWTNNWGGIQDKLRAVWNVLQPALQKLWDWLQTNIPIALQALSNYWQNVLLPAIMKVWNWMQSVLFPFLGALANIIDAVLGKALEALAGLWQNVLQPALEKVWKFIQDNLFPLLERFGGWLGEKLSPAFEGISRAIEKLTGWLGTMADKIRNMKLPSWLTPGSPTPWEIGLRGVGDALKHLARTEMPAFRSSLELQAQPIGLGGGQMTLGSGGGVGVGAVFNINVTSDGITDERDVARKIASAVEVILRERGLA